MNILAGGQRRGHPRQIARLPPARNPAGDRNRFVEVLGIDEEVAAQVFASFREGTIGHERFAITYSNARGRG